MSDNWIALIPQDPLFVPSESARIRALRRFQEIAPEANKIEIKLTPEPSFFDCGSNLERISCPHCSAELDTEWWADRMADDSLAQGFRLASYSTPCCGRQCTLQGLVYDWPQGFACFGIDAMNPGLGELSGDLVAEFEAILATPLRVIYQHI